MHVTSRWYCIACFLSFQRKLYYKELVTEHDLGCWGKSWSHAFSTRTGIWNNYTLWPNSLYGMYEEKLSVNLYNDYFVQLNVVFSHFQLWLYSKIMDYVYRLCITSQLLKNAFQLHHTLALQTGCVVADVSISRDLATWTVFFHWLPCYNKRSVPMEILSDSFYNKNTLFTIRNNSR